LKLFIKRHFSFEKNNFNIHGFSTFGHKTSFSSPFEAVNLQQK